MKDIFVSGNKLTFAGKIYHCAIGKGGFSADKKEGDGCTPLGVFPLRECWYRADKIAKPKTDLPLKIIMQNDGWCDDVNSPDYNRHIKLSQGERECRKVPRHEKLWRDDDVYDLIIPLGYNDSSVIPGKGSAIFMHVARSNYEPTEGCVALKLEDLLEILPFFSAKTLIEIKA
jgi:L,D-peptidoglycan transpeptidase YkuD (ErfK/YbiS/YcfS/YnhG family)